MKIIALLFTLISAICMAEQSSDAQNNSASRNNDATEIPRQLPKSEAIVSAYRKDLDALGRFYGYQFQSQPWTHQVLPGCPEFTKHLLVRYQRTDRPDVAFIVIFPDPQGRVRLIRLGNPNEPNADLPLTRASTIITFNAILREERVGPGTTPGLDWEGLAACYAEIAGEQPTPYRRSTAALGSIAGSIPVEPAKEVVSNVMIEIVSSDRALTSTLSLDFDRHGFVTGAQRLASPRLALVP